MLVGLAHDRIMYLGMQYVDRGYVTQDEYENLRTYLYDPYKKLGGNGSAERVMKEVDKLPIHKFAIGKEENLSYHQSRHSFGTFLISADIPIESIAKMMGHSNIRTTQGYARITDDKISKDMDKLMERRKKISAGEKKENSI